MTIVVWSQISGNTLAHVKQMVKIKDCMLNNSPTKV